MFAGHAGLLLLSGSHYRSSQATTIYAQSKPDGWQSEASHQPVEGDNAGITSVNAKYLQHLLPTCIVSAPLVPYVN